MGSQQPNILDPLTLPLQGRRLIEASAGTGKTYTITLLYLRALLGIGRSRLDTDQILVVTFTEAATAELRDRIRSRIVEARQLFLTGSCSDPALLALSESVDMQPQEAAVLLESAARTMDEASIYTIHGFCQRMLNQNAFESGTLFNREFIMDQSLLLQQAVNDFWRCNFYPLSRALVAEVTQHWKTPSDLLRQIKDQLSKEDLQLLPAGIDQAQGQDLQQLHNEFKQQIIDFKSQWLAEVGELNAIISASGVNKKSYSKATLPKWMTMVSEWSKGNDHSLAKKFSETLEKFSQSRLIEKTSKGEPPSHPLFEQIEALIASQPAYREIILARAISQVRDNLARQKQQRALMSPDDLISLLAKSLAGPMSEVLSARICALYPLALIDEFQDTDPQQYRIFNTIYEMEQESGDNPSQDDRQPVDAPEFSQSDHGLLMIGDPKQAIYGFRGADIFTYIGARAATNDHYSLDTNWRSSTAMVNGVNSLFRFSNSPFIYQQDITFDEVNASPKADSAPLKVAGETLSGLTIWLHPDGDEIVNKASMQKTFARATALEISRLVQAAERGEAMIDDQKQPRRLRPADMAVLVRDWMEAKLIKQALAEQQIDSVFLSRDSVLQTPIAMDLYRLLLAVADPTNERQLNAALATALLGYSAQQLDQFTRDERQWEQILKLFLQAREQWQKLGVLPMLRYLMRELSIAETLVVRDEGERQLTDLLHLGELLQQSSLEVEGEHGLLRWFALQLSEPGGYSDEQQMRLESDRELVKIVTIHSSKGLEYGVVFLPFVCSYKAASKAVYHADGQTLWDLTKSADSMDLADKERLAEDLRLLYVALTRAIYACYLGVANTKKSQGKSSALPNTGLGYLLNSHANGGFEELGLSESLRRLESLSQQWYGATALQVLPPSLEAIALQPSTADELPQLAAKTFTGKILRDWRIGSYSGLVANMEHQRSDVAGIDSLSMNLPFDIQGIDLELQAELSAAASVKKPVVDPQADPQASEVLNAFTFPRGAHAGTFLHSLFENISFTHSSEESLTVVILRQLHRDGYEEKWLPVLTSWLMRVLDSPLPGIGVQDQPVRLRKLADERKRVEMEFVLPVKQLHSQPLNQLLTRYGHLPANIQYSELEFNALNGMLKGFIDLIFEHQGKYYVLDYKSNHLGDTPQHYDQESLQRAMLSHRYDLQYLIYTLALHRYLKTRLPDYDYEQHIGGCYYLFLRGMVESDTVLVDDGSHTATARPGVFADKPSVELILAFDALLEGCEID